MRSMHHASQILSTATTRIHKPSLKQSLERRPIQRPTLRLRNHRRLPVDPQPSEILNHRINKLQLRPLRIKILVAKHQHPTRRFRTKLRHAKRVRMPQMQQACRRRSQPSHIAVSRIHPSSRIASVVIYPTKKACHSDPERAGRVDGEEPPNFACSASNLPEA